MSGIKSIISLAEHSVPAVIEIDRLETTYQTWPLRCTTSFEGHICGMDITPNALKEILQTKAETWAWNQLMPAGDPKAERVDFNFPSTTVFWDDGKVTTTNSCHGRIKYTCDEASVKTKQSSRTVDVTVENDSDTGVTAHIKGNGEVVEVVHVGPFESKTFTLPKYEYEDEYDALLGLMICAYRKVTRNRRSIDGFEWALKELAEYATCPEDLRTLSKLCDTVADIMELDEVKDRLEEDEQDAEPDEDQDTPTTEAPVATTGANERIEELEKCHERTRQAIRDLIDKGEL